MEGETRTREGEGDGELRGTLGDGTLLRALDQVDDEAGGRRTESRGMNGRGSAGRGAALLRARASGAKRWRVAMSDVGVMRPVLGPDRRMAFGGGAVRTAGVD